MRPVLINIQTLSSAYGVFYCRDVVEKNKKTEAR